MIENIRGKPLALSMTTSPPIIPTVGSKKPNKKIKVGLVQLGISFSRQCYLPLSVGMLQAFAQKHLTHASDYEFALPIYQFMKIDEVSETLSDCDVVAYSYYAWGAQNTLRVAEGVKQRNPGVINVFGGPQVPDSKKQFRRIRTTELSMTELERRRIHFTEDFHRANPFIDIACHGEGERVFKMILEQMAIDGCQNKQNIPSISYTDGSGIFRFNPKLERMSDKELAVTPSPLTTGVFDKLMHKYPDQKWILMYETDRGCPYSCTYCDWGGATEDKISKFSMEQIYADIMWAGERRIPYIFLCNANFGILERDVHIAEFFAEAKARYGYPESVNTQNAKNPKKHTIAALKTLERAGLNKATVMSQQTLNPESLKEVRRDNMKLDEYYAIQKELASEGIYTMTDYIIPMPKETYDTLLNGIATLITNGQHNRIQFNNLAILVNTEMGDPEYQERNGFEIVRTRSINTHGKRNASISGIDEWHDLVVATNTMPPEMWLRARTLCWSTGLYYFNKLLQIPLVILKKNYGIDYGESLQLLNEEFQTYGHFPVLEEIRNLFLKTAQGMREGREDFIHAPQWLDIWWPPEEYALIKLCTENKLGVFYDEALRLLSDYAKQKSSVSLTALSEAVLLNRHLIKIPFQTENITLDLTTNVWDAYQSVLLGKDVPLRTGNFQHTVDRTTESWFSWEEWCQYVVWYGNRRGAYLYGRKSSGSEIAGHH